MDFLEREYKKGFHRGGLGVQWVWLYGDVMVGSIVFAFWIGFGDSKGMVSMTDFAF